MEHKLSMIESIVEAMASGAHRFVVPSSDIKPGQGTYATIKAFFQDHADVIDFRIPMLDPFDFIDLPVLDAGAFIKTRRAPIALSMTTNGDQPKIIILGDFEQASLKVQEKIDAIIETVENTPDSTIFFIKLG